VLPFTRWQLKTNGPHFFLYVSKGNVYGISEVFDIQPAPMGFDFNDESDEEIYKEEIRSRQQVVSAVKTRKVSKTSGSFFKSSSAKTVTKTTVVRRSLVSTKIEDEDKDFEDWIKLKEAEFKRKEDAEADDFNEWATVKAQGLTETKVEADDQWVHLKVDVVPETKTDGVPDVKSEGYKQLSLVMADGVPEVKPEGDGLPKIKADNEWTKIEENGAFEIKADAEL